jgi:hypothetical protein
MWATVEAIRTSTFPLIVILGYGLIAAACAEGTEISPSEIVVIQPLAPRDAPDASADASAGTTSVEPAAVEPAPAAAAPEAAAPQAAPAQ